MHRNIFTAEMQPFPPELLDGAVAQLTAAALAHDRSRIRELLSRYVPGCQIGDIGAAPELPADAVLATD